MCIAQSTADMIETRSLSSLLDSFVLLQCWYTELHVTLQWLQQYWQISLTKKVIWTTWTNSWRAESLRSQWACSESGYRTQSKRIKDILRQIVTGLQDGPQAWCRSHIQFENDEQSCTNSHAIWHSLTDNSKCFGVVPSSKADNRFPSQKQKDFEVSQAHRCLEFGTRREWYSICIELGTICRGQDWMLWDFPFMQSWHWSFTYLWHSSSVCHFVHDIAFENTASPQRIQYQIQAELPVQILTQLDSISVIIQTYICITCHEIDRASFTDFVRIESYTLWPNWGQRLLSWVYMNQLSFIAECTSCSCHGTVRHLFEVSFGVASIKVRVGHVTYRYNIFKLFICQVWNAQSINWHELLQAKGEQKSTGEVDTHFGAAQHYSAKSVLIYGFYCMNLTIIFTCCPVAYWLQRFWHSALYI